MKTKSYVNNARKVLNLQFALPAEIVRALTNLLIVVVSILLPTLAGPLLVIEARSLFPIRGVVSTGQALLAIQFLVSVFLAVLTVAIAVYSTMNILGKGRHSKDSTRAAILLFVFQIRVLWHFGFGLLFRSEERQNAVVIGRLLQQAYVVYRRERLVGKMETSKVEFDAWQVEHDIFASMYQTASLFYGVPSKEALFRTASDALKA